MNILNKKLISICISILFILVNTLPSLANINSNSEFKKIIDDDSILAYSKITDSYNAEDDSVIVFIQDLHNDYLIQKEIYNILKILSKNKSFNIYSEGVVDNLLDISIFNYIPNEKIKGEIVNNLFKKSILSACEYFAFENKDNQVNGIEDKQLYYNNLLLLEKINKNKKFNNYIADNIIKFIENLKRQSLVNKVLAIQTLNLNVVDIPQDFPNLQKYQVVSKYLSNINSKKLNSQFKNFVSKSKKNIDVYNLLKLNSNYGYSKVYDYININLPDFQKNNKEFINYLKANKALYEINKVSLVYERENFINQLLSREDLDKSEKEILDLDKFATYLKNLVNTNIMPNHYVILKENRKYVEELFNKYLSNQLLAFSLNLLNNEDFYDFYDTNLNRNKIFIKNLTKDNSNKIIIAGGFHSEITKELKKLNKSYIVLTPNIVNMSHAFNNLFSTALKYGTDEQKIENILAILDSWKIFFSDTETFQESINLWIEKSNELKDKLTINIDNENNVTISYNDKTITKNFSLPTQKEIQYLSKKQQKLFINDMLRIARQYYLFGKSAEIEVVSDDTLLESMIPMRVVYKNSIPIIQINDKFLSSLYNNSDLVSTSIKLLYFYSSKLINNKNFIDFVSQNYSDLQKLYNIKTDLKYIKPSIWFTIKNNINNFIKNIKIRFNNFKKIKTIKEISKNQLKNEDEINMAEALKQATIARQTRGFFTTFIQPPIGAYIVNSDKVVGRNFNRTDSVLHAETLAFIDFLKNYIQENEKTAEGILTEKGKFLTQLLELVFINGQYIQNKTFQNNPMLLKNLGIEIDYSKKRDVNMVFAESNAVLKFVNDQLGNPLSSVKLYCTLAPCNKCAKTMSVLSIDKLIYGSYSVNMRHNSINNLLENGIKVEDGILLKQCDERIVNYKFMNLSMFRTKIASFIQNIRGVVSNIFRKFNITTDYLIANISISEIKILDLKYSLIDLQENLNWNNLQENLESVNKFIEVLKSIDAYDNITKRAGMIFAIKNKAIIKIEKGNIVFYNKDGKKFDFYINIVGKMVVSKNYIKKMEQLAQVKNFTDIDDNIALRDTPFNKEMQSIFSTLTMYGIAQPIPITGNTLEKTRKRLDPLGKEIKNLVSTIYIENAAIQCDIKDGDFVENKNYINNIVKSVINKDTLKDLSEIFGNIQQEWYDLFVSFIEQTKELRKQQNITYEDFTKILVQPKDKYMEHIVQIWGTLSKKEAINEINKIYENAINNNTSKEKFLKAMKIISLLELSRLYFSQDTQDKKEVIRLRQDIEKIEKGENLCNFVDSNVRFVVTAFRPIIVREQIAKYFKNIVQKKYSDLDVINTGLTTMSVCRAYINKSIPLRFYIQRGISAENIIFTGDEFFVGGVDYPIYLLQQEQESKGLVAINTDGISFIENFISLCDINGFSSDISSSENIKRSILLQNIILSILEENIGQIVTDIEYEPINIAQELKHRIYNLNTIDFQKELVDQPEIDSIADVLKAG